MGILESSDSEYEEEQIFTINHLAIDDSDQKIFINISVDGVKIKMEFDTGAALSSTSLSTFMKTWPNKEIERTNTKMKTYTGEIVDVVGKCNVDISYMGIAHKGAWLYIVADNVDTICGRQWMSFLKITRKLRFDNNNSLQLQDISESHCKQQLQNLTEEFADIFAETVGNIPGMKCSFRLKDSNTKPIFFKARPVPYSLREQIEKELDRLEEAGIIQKVPYSPWGTPIVPVPKKDGKLRICADYKATINRVIEDENYPIPRIEDIFAKMSGGRYFCTLDLHKAYLHMQVDDDGAAMQAISTHKGSYKVKRLMFGVKVAPNVWQRFMDDILRDLEGVSCFFDDIQIQGKTYTELLLRMRVVFERLRKHGLHLNKTKCQFLLHSITYLGHVIDQSGIKPIRSKVEAILETRAPQNVTELRTFLGLINFYQKFLPNLASTLRPLNDLLKKDTKFVWSKQCQQTFDKLKQEIVSARTLMPYNPELPLILATDASPCGLGAVISNVLPNGDERPIAFASRSLTKAESNYSQIDKEATAIFWGLNKFFQYCYGRQFTLITDHKPLTRIMHPSNNLPSTSAWRLLHYSNFLSGFNYDIKYRNTKDHGNADYLSRFPLATTKAEEYDANSTFQINQLHTLPVTQKEIRKETMKDSECIRYYNALQSGSELPNGESATDFSLQNGCIFKGIRVIIPSSLRKQILDELHCAHTGVVKMKALARSYVWWKSIDRDIEEVARSCRKCALFKNNPKKESSHPWEYPKQPWQRLHADYAGPFMETNFLIMVDAYSKWVEDIPTKSTNAETTIKLMREVFARFGLPFTLVTDNGTQFRSVDFKFFLDSNGITHKFSAPYHPATNGQAERYVQTIKRGLRIAMNEPGDLNSKLCRLLMTYRKTPNSSTGISPSELLFKREIRTRIDLVKRDLLEGRTKERQNAMNLNFRNFHVGEKVQARFYDNKTCKWKFGIIWSRKGDLHYEVMIDGQKHVQHVDQVRLRRNLTYRSMGM